MTVLAHRMDYEFGCETSPINQPTSWPGRAPQTLSISDEPVCLSDVAGSPSLGVPANDCDDGPGTILVVEDNDLLLTLVADILRDGGFDVLEASSVQKAKRLLANTAAIDVLFSDFRLPDESWFELAKWCQRHRPSVWILLTSGFHDWVAAADQFSILRKPYRLHELMAQLEHLLGSRADSNEPHLAVPADGMDRRPGARRQGWRAGGDAHRAK
jgi:CheY-like chemotaxis protein